MTIKENAKARQTFKQDFFRLVDARVEVAGRIMSGCNKKEYESYGAVRGNLRQAGGGG